MIKDLLKDKTQIEKATIKGQEIVKIAPLVKTTRGALKIKIRNVNAIEGGLEVYLRAWDLDGNQYGFGKDGTIDIERFRVMNPPILVDDANGGIVRESIDSSTGETIIRKLREDPKEALLQSLEHTIGLVAKDGSNIVAGKVGKTTTTLFPAAGAVAPADGRIGVHSGDETLTTLRDTGGSATKFFNMTETTEGIAELRASTTTDQFRQLVRGGMAFDLSVVGSDTISSAILSIFGGSTTKANGLGGSPEIDITSFSPASFSTWATSDYAIANFGSDVYGSVTYAAWSDSGYNDFTFSAAGRTYLEGGTTKAVCSRVDWEVNNSFGGSWASMADLVVQGFYADESGTSKDPKLVVEHAEAVDTSAFFNFM